MIIIIIIIIDSVDLLHSAKWLKNKKMTINPQNNDDKCFQYAIAAALKYEQIEKDPRIISKIKPSIVSIIGEK